MQEVVFSGPEIPDVTDYISYTMGFSIRSVSYEEYIRVYMASESLDTLQAIELDPNGVKYPKEFTSKVYPNPAKELASVEIVSHIKLEQVDIRLHDMSGKQLRGIHLGAMDRGTFRCPINLIDL